MLQSIRPYAFPRSTARTRFSFVPGIVAIGLLCFPQHLTLAATPVNGWERSDKQTYDAIRQEGLQHSQAMRYASELSDGIGARLMGSPNMRKAYDWALATMKGLGMSNVHLEDIGEFGLSWRQNNTWMRMSSPDSMQFEAQAAPWSVSTAGPVEGPVVPVVIADEAAMAKYRGKLRGKVVLLGPLREVPEPFKPFAERYTDEQLADGSAAAPIQRYYAPRADPLDYDSRSHHTNMDTMERLLPGDIAQASVVSAIFAINTADCRELLPRPIKP